MFEEHKDRKVAENEFSQMFENPTKKLVVRFVEGFLDNYHKIKKVGIGYSEYNKSQPDNITLVKKFASDILSYFDSIYRDLHNCNIITSNEEERAKILGGCMGRFLGIIRYGIASPLLNSDSPAIKGRASHLSDFFPMNLVLQKANNIAEKLKEMNKSVKHKFIERQMIKIVDKRADELDDYQKELITKIASLFG